LIEDNFDDYLNIEGANHSGTHTFTTRTKGLLSFLLEVVREDSPSGRILKAIHQAILAPPITEMTLNVGPKLPFKDGGTIMDRISDC
jgi:hypothetical protein